mgnify:CR=1 FL=1
MAINWSLGQIDPNIATNALTAMRAGRQDRRQQDRENALRAYAQGGDVNALMTVDPEAWMQFQQAERETKRALATEDRTTQDRHRAQAVQFWQAVGSQPPETRAAYAAQLAGQMDPTERDRIMTVLPQADLSDEGISGYIQFSGGDPRKLQVVPRGSGGYDVLDMTGGGNIVRSVDPVVKAERMRGPDGIYERNADGEWKKVESFGPAPRQPSRARGGGSSGSAAPVVRSYGSGAEPVW